MDDEIRRVKNSIKEKRYYKTKNEKQVKNNFGLKFVIKSLFTIILTLTTLIVLKAKPNLKTIFYKNVYETNFSFSTLNNLYQKYFGSPIPFKDLIGNSAEPVFNEELNYSEKSLYKDGVKLMVDMNYLVPSLESGLVVFIGEKEDYGNVVIVQQVNGVDLWYGNINNVNVNLYDYIEKGSLIGDVKDNYLYLVYKKEGEVLDYNLYI